jgi:type I restriction enzyme, R subunit
LHTMYVDKRLAGIQAVQTLSRLNRVHPLKEDTFILDFVNDRNEIQEAFKQFYEGATIGEEVEPSRLYELKALLDGSGVYLLEEIERFSEVYFKPKQRQSPNDHRAINAILDLAVDRFRVLQRDAEEESELWRGQAQAFRNVYVFLSQVIPYQDSDLERLHTYLRHLVLKLPKRSSGTAYQFDYRLQKISEGSIGLSDGIAKPLDGPSEVGSGKLHDERVPLSRLIDVINDRFGTDFNEADQLFFDQIIEAALRVDMLEQAASANSVDKFQLVFRQILESLFIERMDTNEDLFARFMNENDFQRVVADWLGTQVYQRFAKKPVLEEV